MIANIKKIEGNWDAGFVLDKHMVQSIYLGRNEYGRAIFDNQRTEVGEAVFQLKYRQDWRHVQPLAEALVMHIIPRLGPIGLVIPMPASNVRARQPVNEVAQAVAERIQVHSFDNIVTKTAAEGDATSLKDLTRKEEKVAALAGRFAIKDTITNEGCWNALVVDDLFHTGASMEAICAALRTYKKIDKIYATALTWR